MPIATAPDAAIDAETALAPDSSRASDAEDVEGGGSQDAGKPATESAGAAATEPGAGAAGHAADSGSEPSEESDDDAGASSEEITDAGMTQAPDAAARGEVITEPEDEAGEVFDQSTLRSYNFVIAPEDLATIDADPGAEEFVNGLMEVDGETYGPVGIRYKGSVGGFRPPCTAGPFTGSPKMGKCSMKVDFNRVDPELRFHGLKKLNFHAMNRDKSMMRDRLGYAMFREFGVAAPRTVHARLSINGNFEGLYIVVEQIDGRFTKSRFSEGGDGNLYKEVWPVSDVADPYLAALETNEDDNPSVDKMLRFKASIAAGADASFGWLDEQYLFNFIAADRVIINDDGAFHFYCSFNHNYYWYESERDDRVWIVPWDMDNSFQNPLAPNVHIATPWNATGLTCSCAATGQMPAACDPLIGQWASRAEDYERAVDAFLAGPLAAENVEAKLAAWTAQIDAVVQEAAGLHGAPSYAEWQDDFATLQTIIESTREHRGYDYSQSATNP